MTRAQLCAYDYQHCPNLSLKLPKLPYFYFDALECRALRKTGQHQSYGCLFASRSENSCNGIWADLKCWEMSRTFSLRHGAVAFTPNASMFNAPKWKMGALALGAH